MLNVLESVPHDVLAWLGCVALTPMFYYAEIPIDDLFLIFKNGADFVCGVKDVDKKLFCSLLQELTNNQYTEMARIEGEMVVSNQEENSHGFLCIEDIRAERAKRNLDFRILTHDEVMQIVSSFHVFSDEYDQLVSFLVETFKIKHEKANEFVSHMSYVFRNTGDRFKGIEDLLLDLRTVTNIDPMKQEDFINLLNRITALYGKTGQMQLCGWSPNELAEKKYGYVPDVNLNMDGTMKVPNPEYLKKVTVIPANSKVAKEMEESKELMDAMGIKYNIAAGSGVYRRQICSPEGISMKNDAIKVYRNDPCPCGSGKKYKRCCGKNVFPY